MDVEEEDGDGSSEKKRVNRNLFDQMADKICDLVSAVFNTTTIVNLLR